MENVKQVIIVRNDIQMSVGKTCSQVAHASMKVILDLLDKPFGVTPVFQEFGGQVRDCQTYTLHAYTDAPVYQWIEGSFTKIVLVCDSLEELLELEKQAKEAGLLNALITDNGLTEFKEICPNCTGLTKLSCNIDCGKCDGTGKINKPTITCLAIGPDYSEKIDKLTSHLKLR